MRFDLNWTKLFMKCMNRHIQIQTFDIIVILTYGQVHILPLESSDSRWQHVIAQCVICFVYI